MSIRDLLYILLGVKDKSLDIRAIPELDKAFLDAFDEGYQAAMEEHPARYF